MGLFKAFIKSVFHHRSLCQYYLLKEVPQRKPCIITVGLSHCIPIVHHVRQKSRAIEPIFGRATCQISLIRQQLFFSSEHLATWIILAYPAEKNAFLKSWEELVSVCQDFPSVPWPRFSFSFPTNLSFWMFLSFFCKIRIMQKNNWRHDMRR